MSVDVERRIRDRAYAIWLDEGRPHGRDADHWFQAERAILAETTAVPDVPQVIAVVKAPRKTTNAKPRAVVKTAGPDGTTSEPPEPPKTRKSRSRKPAST